MEEIDALGRQMLIDRPPLTRGRLTVFRDASEADDWFPHVTVTLKRAGSDAVLWQWMSHQVPIDEEQPPPYGDEIILEKYFELDSPLKSPRGLEAVLKLDRGSTLHGMAYNFSVSLYLYPRSLEDRGVQVGVVDFPGGLATDNLPLYFRVNFPW